MSHLLMLPSPSCDSCFHSRQCSITSARICQCMGFPNDRGRQRPRVYLWLPQPPSVYVFLWKYSIQGAGGHCLYRDKLYSLGQCSVHQRAQPTTRPAVKIRSGICWIDCIFQASLRIHQKASASNKDSVSDPILSLDRLVPFSLLHYHLHWTTIRQSLSEARPI